MAETTAAPSIDVLSLFPKSNPWIVSAMVSTRGGSGKTTCTVLLGLYNCSRGIPTIMIDTDRDAALTNVVMRTGRLNDRVSPNDKSIRPSLVDVINAYQASGDVMGTFQRALTTTDAYPDDQNLLLLPSDHRMKNIDFDGDLREAFLSTIKYLMENGPAVFGPRIVLVDPSNHPFSIECALRAVSGCPRGGAFITFPPQGYAIPATQGTSKLLKELKVKMLGFIPIRFGGSQKYTDFMTAMRTRGQIVLTGIKSSGKIQAPYHLWAISNKFPKEFAYSVNEMTRSLLPGFPAEPPQIDPEAQVK
jgi:hypothetical protein